MKCSKCGKIMVVKEGYLASYPPQQLMICMCGNIEYKRVFDLKPKQTWKEKWNKINSD